jgi:hypothetical protein
MITVQNISFRIYGGSVNGGLYWQPFVAVGDVPQEFVPKPPVLVNEQQVWMITHAQNYTLYTICSKRCYTQDGQQGLMLISLFLPPQQRLADGKSPLDLLGLLMDCFAVHAIRDGKLPEGPVNNAPFVLLLEEFRLEKRPMLLPIMQGQEPAAFCLKSKAQLDALMRHSRYPVLANVGRLELGFECESTISLNTSGVREKPKAKTPPPPSPEAVVTPPPVEPKTPSPVEPEPPSSAALVLEPPTNPIPITKTKSTLASSDYGGLSLDDSPIVTKSKSGAKNGAKKVLKVLAIIVGAMVSLAFGLFVVLMVIGSIASSDDGNYNALEEAACADSIYDEEVVEAAEVEVIDAEFVNDHLGEYNYSGPIDEDGMPHGVGEAKFVSGRFYNGPFDHGVMQGENAEFRMENGDIFKGSFKNNQFEKGTYTMVASGEYFQGTFKDEQPSVGTWYSKDGKKLQDVK